MAKIVLISPYPNVFAIGLRILSSCLKNNGHEVKLLFLLTDITERDKSNVLDEVWSICRDAELIGISVMTNLFKKAVWITQGLKERGDIPIIWGGIHPTILPVESLNYADMVCMGEGEEALVELAAKIQRGEDFLHVRGIWSKRSGEIIKNELRPLINDLDSLPIQDFDYETHYLLKQYLQRVDRPLMEKYMGGHYTTVASRGCYYECGYCANNALNRIQPDRRRIRKRSVASIMAELKMVKKQLPFIKGIQFEDDAFLAYTEEEIADFARQYKDDIGLKLNVTGLSPTTISRKKIQSLVDAGLTYVRMGIQTASESTKKLYRRPHSNQQVEKAAGLINEFKDKIPIIKYDIIIDNPWETDEDLAVTLMFLAKLPIPYVLDIYSLTFFPGTELYDRAKRESIIEDDEKDVYGKLLNTCKKTYMNRLFFLMREYSEYGPGLSTSLIGFLVNKRARGLKISWGLYIILRAFAFTFRPTALMRKGFKELRRGNFSKIVNYLKSGVNACVK